MLVLQKLLKLYTIFIIYDLYKAGGFTEKNFKLRLVGGAWCLVGLILVTAYGSVITSFITAPHSEPLVESVKDVAEKSNVKIATMKGLAVDFTISVTPK